LLLLAEDKEWLSFLSAAEELQQEEQAADMSSLDKAKKILGKKIQLKYVPYSVRILNRSLP
jgi:hypothetical protein